MSVVGLMSNTETGGRTKSDVNRSRLHELQELAAQIMGHLEDAHDAARRIQEPGLDRVKIAEGFCEVKELVSQVDGLLPVAE